MKKETTVIELLNNFVKGKEIKGKFKVSDGTILKSLEELLEYEGLKDEWYDLKMILESLNDKVEIIEEPEELREIHIYQDFMTDNYFVLNEHDTKCYMTKHSKIIAEKVNEIIRYIKEKGE